MYTYLQLEIGSCDHVETVQPKITCYGIDIYRQAKGNRGHIV